MTVLSEPRGSLYLPATRLAGLRPDECARVVELIGAGRRLVTVTGLGGVGKSTLALDVVEALRARQPEWDFAVVTVDDSGRAGVRELLLDVLEPSGDAGGTEERTADSAGAPCLVVLDGAEHLDDAAEIQRVLDDVPGLRLLVTSRVPLGLPSEVVVPLRGLGTRADGGGVQLFLALAAEQGAELAPGDHRRVHEIVTRLGGYPLAIRLCAIRLRTQSLDAVHEAVMGRASGARAEPTDATLHDVIRWSIDRQNAPARQLLRLLAVFSGWSTLDSIEGVASRVGDQPPGRRRNAGQTMWLAELVEAGLVDVERASPTDDAIVRYRAHDSVREVVLEYPAADDVPLAALRAAHREWYLEQVTELAAAVGTRRETEAFQQLQDEFSEYATTLDALVDADPSAGLSLVNQVGEYWMTRGRLHTGARLLRRALRALGEDVDGLGSGTAATTLAQSWLAHMKLRGGVRIAAADYQRWLATRLQAASGASPEDLTLAMHLLFAALVTGEHEEALRLGARFRDRALEAGDDYQAGVLSFYLARVAEQSGDLPSATAHIERAIMHVRRTQNEAFLARCVSKAALLEHDELTPAELVQRLGPVVDIHLRNRSFKDAALISYPLAIAHAQAGDPAASLALLRRALELSTRIHFFDGQLYAVVLIAFADLSAESTPENVARCARLYGGIRPYLPRFHALTPPHYGELLEGGIRGLRYLLGQPALDRVIARSPTSWPDVMADADDFAAELLEGLTASADGRTADAAERVARALEELNARERELLDLVLTGITDKQIASRLALRPNTVRSYNSRIFRKFGVASRTELLALMRGR